MEKKNLSFKRIGFNYASNSVLFADRENKVMMFFGNKTEYIKSVINMVKGTPAVEEVYLDLLEVFNIYQEVTEQELLEKGYILMSNEDKTGVYHIKACFPNNNSLSKTVLRTTCKVVL